MPTIADLVIDDPSWLDSVGCIRTPSCAEWLAGKTHIEPDHVCWHVATKSVREFLTQWGLTGTNEPAYFESWPLPVGANALSVWHAQRAPLELSAGSLIERLYRWIPLNRTDAKALMGRELHLRVPTITPHPVLASVASSPDAWLYAVARRQTEAGTVWMLGTAWLDQTDISLPDQDAGSVKVTTREYVWDSDGERIAVYGDKGELASVRYVWKYGYPYIVTVSVGGGGEDARVFAGKGRQVTLSPLDNLFRESRKLAGWWFAMLGRTTGGRPTGTKEGWRDKEHFIAEVETAIAAIDARNDVRVTQANVAEELYRKGYLSSRRNSKGEDIVKQFRRDRKDFGYPTWEALKKACSK